MSHRTYAIGDVQGCLAPLQALLTKIEYNPKRDALWFTGDLANRGPEPLATLRFIQSLPNTICVLGNHDLALLAAAAGAIKLSASDTMSAILTASDATMLLTWLRHRPLLHHDPQLQYTITHAGIFPAWDLDLAKNLANEVEKALQAENSDDFLHEMYGNQPTHWESNHRGWNRLRFITNAFTRMRFCTKEGELELHTKAEFSSDPNHIPWFAFPARKTQQEKLLFGHWAALQGKCEGHQVYPLDSGCIWGNCLTAFCLETEQRFTVNCKEYINRTLSAKS